MPKTKKDTTVTRWEKYAKEHPGVNWEKYYELERQAKEEYGRKYNS